MTQAPPPGGGMPKWLIILLVVLLIVILGCCGGFVACQWACRRAATGMQGVIQTATQKAHDEMVAATQRAATQIGMDMDTTGRGLPVPSEFPTDIPIASGFKIRMKIIPPGANQGNLILWGSDSPKTVQAFYEKEMPAKGWTQVNATATSGGSQLLYTKEKRTASIVIGKEGSDTSMDITFATQN